MVASPVAWVRTVLVMTGFTAGTSASGALPGRVKSNWVPACVLRLVQETAKVGAPRASTSESDMTMRWLGAVVTKSGQPSYVLVFQSPRTAILPPAYGMIQLSVSLIPPLSLPAPTAGFPPFSVQKLARNAGPFWVPTTKL